MYAFIDHNVSRDTHELAYRDRSCPGINLAETTLFLTCAMILATFDIRRPIVNGKEVVPPVEYLTGTVS